MIKQRAVSVKTLELAVSKCATLDTPPTYMGPHAVDGLNVGDDVEEHMQGSIDSSDPGSGTESDCDPEDDPGADPEDDSGAEDGHAALDELMADVEALTPNAHVGVIRALIARHDLYYQGAPISPGTGDRNGRTKFDMLQEVRHAVGADPLPDSALRARRAKPDVPMGKPVTRLDGHRIDFGSPKAPRGAEPDVERKSMCGITCGAPFLLAMLGQLLMVCMSMHANGNFVSCRTISPSWVCKSLGYIDPALAAMPNTITPKIGSLPGDDAFVREPGAQMYEQVGTDVRHTGLHLLLPLLACLVLLFHTLGVTAHFASRRLTRRARAWSRPPSGHTPT